MITIFAFMFGVIVIPDSGYDPDAESTQSGSHSGSDGDGIGGEFTAASWAEPIPTGGRRIASYTGEGFTADLFHLERFTARSGNSRHDYKRASAFSGGKVRPGDVIDVYSCVITNTSGNPIGMSTTSINARIFYDGTSPLNQLYNFDLDRARHLDYGANTISEDAALQPGYSVAISTPVIRQAGKILNVNVEIDRKYGVSGMGLYGGMHIVTP